MAGRHSRQRKWAPYVVVAVLLLVALGVSLGVALSGGSNSANRSGSPPVTRSSSPSRPVSSPTTSAPSSTFTATGIPPSSSSSSGSVSCTSVTTQAQIDSMKEGKAVHTVVEPFGCVTVYKVKPKDNLWDIANAFMVAGQYKPLYEWNKSVVGQNPNLIHPGQVILVDPTGKVTAPSD